MTILMSFAYLKAYAAALVPGYFRRRLRLDDSCRYQRLLITLDGIHGGDFPATYPMPRTRTELLAHLEDEIDRMIALGGDGLSLELLLAGALGW